MNFLRKLVRAIAGTKAVENDVADTFRLVIRLQNSDLSDLDGETLIALRSTLVTTISAIDREIIRRNPVPYPYA